MSELAGVLAKFVAIGKVDGRAFAPGRTAQDSRVD